MSDPTPAEGQAPGLTLPPLTEAVLDPPTLSALFADIAAYGEVVEIVEKGAPRAHARGASPSLEEARVRLTSGAVRGVQIRYRFDGIEWWDTLMNTPEGIRLVRIGHDWKETP